MLTDKARYDGHFRLLITHILHTYRTSITQPSTTTPSIDRASSLEQPPRPDQWCSSVARRLSYSKIRQVDSAGVLAKWNAQFYLFSD